MLITIQNIDRQIQRIEAFSDTHGRHRELLYNLEMTDILVCAGDVCEDGDEVQIRDFFEWFAEQPAPHKLFVPGNHDLPFDLDPENAKQYISEGITCIESGSVMLCGVHFFILPVRPWIHEQDMSILTYLPQQVDVLVTHGAPKGILDREGRVGCPILRELVDKINPKVHIFGHCHERGRQNTVIGNTLFVNVAMMTLRERLRQYSEL